ncbi:amidohydrolase family protein [bacterium]|nr:amidohydrolase family protein [bacterium]
MSGIILSGLSIGLFLSTPVYSQDCIQITAKEIYDPATDQILKGTSLVVQNGKIHSLTSEPNDCSQLDLSKLTLIPGLIDLHTHIFLEDKTAAVRFSDELVRLGKWSSDQRTSFAKDQLRSILKSGFTTIRDVGNSGMFLDTKLRDSLASDSEVLPRIFGTGPGIATEQAQFKTGVVGIESEYFLAKLPFKEEAFSPFLKNKVDGIKIYADNDPGKGQMPEELLKQLVTFFHSKKLKVSAHATNDASAWMAANAGVDSIEHGYGIKKRTLELMAQKKIYLIPTEMSTRVVQLVNRRNPDPLYVSARELHRKRGKRLRLALTLGVPIGFGSDAYMDLSKARLSRGELTLESLIAYSEEGLPASAVLKTATVWAADFLGRDDLGRIREGATADLVGYEKSPLKTAQGLKEPSFIMKDGKIVLFRQARK